MIIRQATIEEAWFVADRICYTPSIRFKALVQVDDRNNLVAATGYDHWTPNSVQMHSWIPGKKTFSRRFIQESFRYPFVIGNRGLAIGVTPGDNAPALELNRRLGFCEVHRIKDGWTLGTDMVIQEMRRDQCRWISGVTHGHGTNRSSTSAAAATAESVDNA